MRGSGLVDGLHLDAVDHRVSCLSFVNSIAFVVNLIDNKGHIAQNSTQCMQDSAERTNFHSTTFTTESGTRYVIHRERMVGDTVLASMYRIPVKTSENTAIQCLGVEFPSSSEPMVGERFDAFIKSGPRVGRFLTSQVVELKDII